MFIVIQNYDEYVSVCEIQADILFVQKLVKFFEKTPAWGRTEGETIFIIPDDEFYNLNIKKILNPIFLIEDIYYNALDKSSREHATLKPTLELFYDEEIIEFILNEFVLKTTPEEVYWYSIRLGHDFTQAKALKDDFIKNHKKYIKEYIINDIIS